MKVATTTLTILVIITNPLVALFENRKRHILISLNILRSR